MRSLQARGRPEEAAREVRALLDVVRENETAVQKIADSCSDVLKRAGGVLKVLRQEVGDEELIKAVAVAWDKLRRVTELTGVPRS